MSEMSPEQRATALHSFERGFRQSCGPDLTIASLKFESDVEPSNWLEVRATHPRLPNELYCRHRIDNVSFLPTVFQAGKDAGEQLRYHARNKLLEHGCL